MQSDCYGDGAVSVARKGGVVALLDPKNDYVFKRLFAGDPELTLALINDLRPDLPRVISVEFLNPVIDASEEYRSVASAIGIHLLVTAWTDGLLSCGSVEQLFGRPG